MASHKKTESNQIIKTFSFKIKNANGLSLDVLNDAITEYQNYILETKSEILDSSSTIKIFIFAFSPFSLMGRKSTA